MTVIAGNWAVSAVTLCTALLVAMLLPAAHAALKEGDAVESGTAARRITVVGTRITQGNAVDCPQVRGDDGTITVVSYLAPAIPIGTRVKVTGFFAYVTSCRGRVLKAEEVAVLDQP